jgi:hypothetical protein
MACAIFGLATIIALLFAIPLGHLALRQIRRGGGTLKGKGQARFGLFCGYGLLMFAAYLVFWFFGEAQRIHEVFLGERVNVQIIEKAKEAWAAANDKKPGDQPAVADLAPFMPDGQFPPRAIEGETYQINPVGTKATVTRPPSMP